MIPLRYQSPIALNINPNTFCISQKIRIKGRNNGATFIPENKIFKLNDKITLKINSKKYRLVEYHFHAPAEHTINNKLFPAEIHYVFYDIEKHEQKVDNQSSNSANKCMDVCSCQNTEDENILVIGILIKDTVKQKNLNNIQVTIPAEYFEYDGSLTGSGDEATPVRWIVGNRYIKLPLSEINEIAKSSRPIQPLDNRIILYKSSPC